MTLKAVLSRIHSIPVKMKPSLLERDGSMSSLLTTLLLATFAESAENQYGWPTDLNANLNLVRQIQEKVPGKLETAGTADGTFIALLEPVSALAVSDRPPSHPFWTYLDDNQQSDDDTFCAQLVAKFEVMNMALVHLSPDCSLQVAQLEEVTMLEANGEITLDPRRPLLAPGPGS